MMVLNERVFVEQMLIDYQMLDKPQVCLRRLAKYYRANGYSEAESARLIENFLQRNDKFVNLLRWETSILAAIRYARHNDLMESDGIVIYKEELQQIAKLDGSLLRRLTFTILCAAKYRAIQSPESEGWVTVPRAELFSMANISMKFERQAAMLNTLISKGLIEYSKRFDSQNFRCLYLRTDGEPAATIVDMRNLGNQYRMLNGESFMACQSCGRIVQKKSNRQKYCSKCAATIKRKNDIQRILDARSAAGKE